METDRPWRRLLRASALFLAFVLLSSACGGGGSGEEDAADTQALSLLQKVVLTAEEVPQGLQPAPPTLSTNQDLADESADPDAEMARLNRLGRRLGYEVQFLPGGAAPANLKVSGMQNSVSLYQTEEGASTALNEGVTAARAHDWPSLYPDLTDVHFEEAASEGLPPGTAWFRVTGLNPNLSLVVDDQVAFRVGPVRSFLRVASIHGEERNRDVYKDEVASWLSTLIDRIQAVLQEEAPGTPRPSG